MTKAIVLILALTSFSAVAQAAESAGIGTKSDELTVTRAHHYWLSDGLTRLAFWQAPQLQTGRSVAKTP